ncbi:hypothetical protein ACFYZI_41940 [Streptomyces griseorubiginosus]|jgi:hypothetical protein|uniref:hypothetical protein n=1 Tax=Streptomyces TaxID=1883 RepID=UPI0036A4A4B4
MELHIPLRGSICLPDRLRSSAEALGDLVRRTGHRITDTVRRGSAPVRAGLCGAVGATAGTAAFFMGVDPEESVSLGTAVATTVAAFWPPNASGGTPGRTETC